MAPKALLLVQLSLLLVSFISATVHTDHATLKHPHPPLRAPAPHHVQFKPPVHPPVKPPTASSPKQIAIRGVVFCKSCEHKGVNTLNGAKPLFKAVVKLHCNNTKHSLVETTKTDKNGVFVFRPKKVMTTLAFHKCKVFLVSSSNNSCRARTNFHGGVSGAVLIPDRKLPSVAASLYNVRPLAFEPSKKCSKF